MDPISDARRFLRVGAACQRQRSLEDSASRLSRRSMNASGSWQAGAEVEFAIHPFSARREAGGAQRLLEPARTFSNRAFLQDHDTRKLAPVLGVGNRGARMDQKAWDGVYVRSSVNTR